jgi:hypothetical protein
MAMSKAFVDGVMSLAAKGAALAEKLQALGGEAVKAAYANKDNEKAQFILDNIPQYMRKPFASWLKRAGIEVFDPSVGSARYKVQGVIDSKRQSKAFEFIEKNAVLVVEATIKQPKKEKPLEGTPADRAAKAVGSLISRIKEKDPETALLINDTWANNPVSCLYLSNGQKITLDENELSLIVDLLTKRESIRLAA